MKEESLKKTISKILIVAFTIIVFWHIGSMFNNGVVDKQPFPNIENNSLGKANCENNRVGWSCKLVTSDSRPFLRGNDLIYLYEGVCTDMGGIFRLYGAFSRSFGCEFKFKDAGDLCISSFQCGGTCLGSLGIGRCSEYSVSACDSQFTEIVFGIPINSPAILCD